MSDLVLTEVSGHTGIITLNRPSALNTLTLDMVRTMSSALLDWRDQADIHCVMVRSSSEKAYCAGGDIRFFYQKGKATATEGAALIEDFFTEEYALNHLIHHYPKPYIALMDGVVMGGGMGIAQAGPAARIRIVTERTKMAMPEVGIGLFPDVGGGHFLSRAKGQLGTYLGVTGEMIGASDALYAGLADVFVPAAELPALQALVIASPANSLREDITRFAAPFAAQADPAYSRLAEMRELIEQHFSSNSITALMTSLLADTSEFAGKTLEILHKRSPLMMCVTLSQLRRAATMPIGDCLRMERTMVRRCFEHGEVIEGVRALAIDKDHAPNWNPATLAEVTPAMVERFFESAWPSYAHPLR
ncbi:MAG: enoyl-CoA hydratase/isomerase family protein, partial [Burkholderiaceae bacterium]|nr:enoyl-CoA hydratase/isomerase family protein [Burkholderiaceae bacterium]